MTPSRACYRQVFHVAQQIIDTYNYLPDAQARYPFFFVQPGDSTARVMNEVIGSTLVRVHIFGTMDQLKEMDNSLVKLHNNLLKIPDLFGYHLTMTGWRDTYVPETDDAPGIQHWVADITLNYTRSDRA